MRKTHVYPLFFIMGLALTFTHAATLSEISQKELLLPPPPTVQAKAYFLMDATTGTVIAEKNSNVKMRPASLTKLMTSYIMFHAISKGHASIDDEVRVSTNAWKTEGSRMFLGENAKVELESLLKGVIITSANDASVALSEHYAGSEQSFAGIMNRHANEFGMNNTHFMTATGLDHKEHYSTAHDLAKLSGRIINDFPEFFHWFQEESISHGGIEQSNRNKLMLTHPEVDGLKTGYTQSAGYCLATTAKKGNTRLILVTLNSPSAQSRDRDTMALINYGFRFYETSMIYPKHTTITDARVYQGILNSTELVTHKPFWITVPKGAKEHLSVDVQSVGPLVAPITTKEQAGIVVASINQKEIASAPLYAHTDIQQSHGLKRYTDKVKMFFGL